MADYTIKPSLITPLIDAIAFASDPRLDQLMEDLDAIRKETEAGRAILIAVEPYNEAIR